jgi:uncharacterized membrane protein
MGMADGLPLELVVMGFPEPEVPDAVDVALRRLTFLGDLRVAEAAAVAKDADGVVALREVDHLVTADGPGQPPPRTNLLVAEQIDAIGQMLQPGRSALALVLEHAWVNELGDAFRKGRGAVLVSTWVEAPPMTRTASD